MAGICCQRFIKKYVLPLVQDKEVTGEEAHQNIKNEAQYLTEGTGADKKRFWDNYAYRTRRENIYPLLNDAFSQFIKEQKGPGIAIDLGSGSNLCVVDLLERGWRVVAVDSSKEACRVQVAIVQRFTPRALKSFQAVQTKMENYVFPKNIRLILAHDALMYCDPKKFRKLWNKIHAALEPGGRLVANFFPKPSNKVEEEVHRQFMGAWFVDKPAVKALLKEKGYTVEVLEYNKYWFMPGPRAIQFMAQKN